MDGDFLLIQKMRQGDDRAVEQFVVKYYSKVLLYCKLHLPESCAEDMAQETFEKFFRAFPGYKHRGKAAAYLYAIAANSCRDYHKKRREQLLEDLPQDFFAESAAADEMSGVAERLDITAALHELPEEMRQVAVFFFCLGVKQREIAEILGIGLPLVKYRIKKARQMLAAALEKEGY